MPHASHVMSTTAKLVKPLIPAVPVSHPTSSMVILASTAPSIDVLFVVPIISVLPAQVSTILQEINQPVLNVSSLIVPPAQVLMFVVPVIKDSQSQLLENVSHVISNNVLLAPSLESAPSATLVILLATKTLPATPATLTTVSVAQLPMMFVMLVNQDSVSTPQDLPAVIPVMSTTAKNVMMLPNVLIVYLVSSSMASTNVPAVPSPIVILAKLMVYA